MSNETEVVVSSASGLTQEITSGPHRSTADEPVELGGGGLGPSPYELLLASLGACTSMTLRLYATRKGWDLQKITVRLRHHRVHAQDCIGCEKKRPFLDRIERELQDTFSDTYAQPSRLQRLGKEQLTRVRAQQRSTQRVANPDLLELARRDDITQYRQARLNPRGQQRQHRHGV